MNDRFKIKVRDKVFNHYWTDEEIKENAAWLLFPDNDNIENIEIEQCTGLKDKNESYRATEEQKNALKEKDE